MALPNLSTAKTYDDNQILFEQDLDAMFLTELHNKFFIQTSISLTDNTSSPAAAISLTASSNTALNIEYSLTRGSGNIETGMIHIVNDGTNADVVASSASLGTLGVTFTADVSGGNVRLLYVTTSTGTSVSMKYRVISWQA